MKFGRRKNNEGRSICLKKNKKFREKDFKAILTYFITLPTVAVIILECGLSFLVITVY